MHGQSYPGGHLRISSSVLFVMSMLHNSLSVNDKGFTGSRRIRLEMVFILICVYCMYVVTVTLSLSLFQKLSLVSENFLKCEQSSFGLIITFLVEDEFPILRSCE